MMERTPFSLNPETFAFLQEVGGTNKSAYINDLLTRERQRTLEEAILQANEEEAQDSAYQEDLSEWKTTLSESITD